MYTEKEALKLRAELDTKSLEELVELQKQEIEAGQKIEQEINKDQSKAILNIIRRQQGNGYSTIAYLTALVDKISTKKFEPKKAIVSYYDLKLIQNLIVQSRWNGSEKGDPISEGREILDLLKSLEEVNKLILRNEQKVAMISEKMTKLEQEEATGLKHKDADNDDLGKALKNKEEEE